MRSVFDYHISSALFTDYVGYLIFYLNFFKFLFCCLYCLIQIRIEIANYRFPLNQSFCNTVEQFFHCCRKMYIYNTWERSFHNIIDYFTNFCHIKVFIFLCNIPSCNNRSNGWCVGTWTSNSKFF